MIKTLDIVIPTYNRKDYLIKNIVSLIDYILSLKVVNRIGIIISDNCSSDGTAEEIRQIQQKSDANLTIYEQGQNIGGLRNIIFLIEKSKADFVMLLGDDDFISEGYLAKVLKYIDFDDEITTIVPNNYNTLSYKYRTPLGKDVIVNYPRCLSLLLYVAQISGVVFRREGTVDAFKKTKSENMYLQIFLAGFSAMKGKTVHILSDPLEITIPEVRRWNYSRDMLLGDLFENFVLLGVSPFMRSYIEMKHISHCAKSYIALGVIKVSDMWMAVIQCNSITLTTKLFFPLYLAWGIVKGVVRRTRFLLSNDKSKYIAGYYLCESERAK